MHSNLIETRQAFSDLDFWPPQRSEINPQGWLGQFDLADQALAEELLESFMFFNQRHTEQLFVSALMDLSRDAARGTDPVTSWRAYRNTVVVSFPGEEDQNPTDSGHTFARLTRQRFGIEAERIFAPADLVTYLAAVTTPLPILIVDDFLGSGDQFLASWRELVYVAGVPTTLEEQARRLESRVDYVVAVATSTGIAELKEHASAVAVSAGSTLDPEASAKHPSTRVVSPQLRSQLGSFLEKYAERAGYESRNVWGHKELATTVAFDHGVPDSTLPIFWHAENWIPLRRRA